MRALRKQGDPRRRIHGNVVNPQRMENGYYQVGAYAAAFRRMERKLEFEEQHGPVRHLVSEGKPVSE